MRIYKQKGSSNWWASWYDQSGKRCRRSTGTSDKRLAEGIAGKWSQDDFMAEHFGKTPDVPFTEALMRYAKIQKRDYNASFMKSTRYRLRKLQDRFSDYMLADITASEIEGFMDERLDEVTRESARKELSTLRAILNRAHREELLDRVPLFPKFKKAKSRTRWLTQEEEQRLVSHAPDHLVPVIHFALDTGGRLSEIFGLDWRYVDLANRRITFVKTKNGDDRTIRLCNRAYDTLQELNPASSGPVFTYKGKAVKDMRSAFERTRNLAGLDDVRFHDLRHTFASRLVQGGVPLYDVMHLTGHKSLEMVQRYSHLAPDYQEGSMRVLDRYWQDLDIVEKGGENSPNSNSLIS